MAAHLPKVEIRPLGQALVTKNGQENPAR